LSILFICILFLAGFKHTWLCYFKMHVFIKSHQIEISTKENMELNTRVKWFIIKDLCSTLWLFDTFNKKDWKIFKRYRNWYHNRYYFIIQIIRIITHNNDLIIQLILYIILLLNSYTTILNNDSVKLNNKILYKINWILSHHYE
jgi:predicted RNA-binding protein associated with RNAse of E/G family